MAAKNGNPYMVWGAGISNMAAAGLDAWDLVQKGLEEGLSWSDALKAAGIMLEAGIGWKQKKGAG
jgi:hypothetical protein